MWWYLQNLIETVYHGSLKSDFDTGSLVQEMDTIKIPVVDKKSPTGLSVEKYPILHPHRVLSYLFDVVKIEIDMVKLHNFWDHARSVGEPWAVSSPATREHIPLGVHGDSARLWTVYQVEKQMSISLNLPLFRPRSTRFSRFVVFTCPSNKLYKNRTLNAVWRRLVWSINACFDGLNPTVGVGGVALTGPDALRAGTPMTAQRPEVLFDRNSRRLGVPPWLLETHSSMECHKCMYTLSGFGQWAWSLPLLQYPGRQLCLGQRRIWAGWVCCQTAKGFTLVCLVRIDLTVIFLLFGWWYPFQRLETLFRGVAGSNQHKAHFSEQKGFIHSF